MGGSAGREPSLLVLPAQRESDHLLFARLRATRRNRLRRLERRCNAADYRFCSVVDMKNLLCSSFLLLVTWLFSQLPRYSERLF